MSDGADVNSTAVTANTAADTETVQNAAVPIQDEAANMTSTKPADEVKETCDMKVETTIVNTDHSVKQTDDIKMETSDVTVKPAAVVSELEQKIIKQIEFYFGDVNIARDKFLKEQIKLDDGWVTLAVMLRFNRLKAICGEESIIAGALRKSTTGLLEVSDDGKKIRRCPQKPVDKERMVDTKMRTVYVKGFPVTATLDELMTFFEKFGHTELVQMRRKQGAKEFKGSCFVIFERNEIAEKFLAETNVTYNDVDLLREYKHDYFQRKSTERKQKGSQKTNSQQLVNVEESVQKEMVTGAVLCVSNLPQSCFFKDLREFFSKFGTVRFVDHKLNDTTAWVRFDGVDGAKTALAKAKELGNGKITYKDKELECIVLEGEAEQEHWKGVIKSKQEVADKLVGQNQRSQDIMKQMVPGAILCAANLPRACSVDELKEFFGKFGEVRWVDHFIDKMEARIRFSGVDGAKTALVKAKESVDGKITFKDQELECSVLEGENELKHWKDWVSAKSAASGRDGSWGGKRKFGGGRRGGRQDRNPRKKAKFDGEGGGDSGDSD